MVSRHCEVTEKFITCQRRSPPLFLILFYNFVLRTTSLQRRSAILYKMQALRLLSLSLIFGRSNKITVALEKITKEDLLAELAPLILLSMERKTR